MNSEKDQPTPEHPQLVFLIGSPRSGTTWLQSLLGDHPSVVTPQETDLFSTFIAPLQTWWDRQLSRPEEERLARRAKGLPAVVDDAEFSAMMRGIIDTTLTAIHRLDPDATVIVEKSPAHSRHTALIHRYLPEARFIHIIRDGRDVVSSLRSAAEGWGRFWAPSGVNIAARTWRTNVLAAREAATYGTYAEVRYEDLRAGDAGSLRTAYAQCGLDVGLDECGKLLSSYSLERMASGQAASTIAMGGAFHEHGTGRGEPAGFFGPGSVGSWRSWSRVDRETFDAAAGDLLVALGYEPDHDWAGSPATLRRFATTVRGKRAMLALGRRVGRWSERNLSQLPEV